jgi:hypothetical protein
MNAMRATCGLLARIARFLGLGRHAERDREPAAAVSVEPTERGRLAQRILSTIHNNSILLTGAPGCGKRSILLEVGQRLAAGGDPVTEFFPVRLELRGVPERLLFATVADAVLCQLDLEPPTRVACVGAAYTHRDLVRDFRAVISTLGARTSRQARLVLLVDGIDALDHYHPRTMQKIRALFMTSLDGALVMVATAVEIDKQWSREGSPWYNFFEEISLAGPCPATPDCWHSRDTMPRNGGSSST